jgi:hypothetical protein
MGGGPTVGAQTAVAKALVLDPSKPARSIKVRFAAGGLSCSQLSPAC